MNDHKNTLRFATISGNSLKKVESGAALKIEFYYASRKIVIFVNMISPQRNI